jgi:cell division protein FtsW
VSATSAPGDEAPGAVSRGLSGVRERAASTLGLLDRPLTSYYLVLGITLLLIALGLVMVLSTTSAFDLANGISTYSGFVKQLLGVLVGLPLMWGASRCPPRLFRALAYPAIIVSVLGLLAVLGFGKSIDGGVRWIQVGPLPLEPSELAKLGFMLWGADLLARKEKLGALTDWRHLLIPLMPGAAILSLLVLSGDDLGTTFVLLVIFLTLLWVIGTPNSLMLGMLGLIGFVLVILILVAGYRLRRITAFFSHPGPNTQLGWQPSEGKYALGSGGFFGVGMGASRAKWGWVPESTTDFIFAILGEELGLVGTLCVTLLYGGLAYAGLRIARRVTDTFVRLAAASITAWIVAQAVVNIGSVLGLLPITGVPLPLISQGLSSLLATMVALGMLLAFARQEPGAAQALAAAGPGMHRRILSWLNLSRRRR